MTRLRARRAGHPLVAAAALIAAAALALLATLAPQPAAGATTSRVRVPIPADDGTLTPYTFNVAYPLLMLVYDSLYVREPGSAQAKRGVHRPWLARTLRRDEDGRRVTITLRPGLRWHDGRPLTARDVAFTYRLFARRFHPRFTPQLRAIASVTALDGRTVVFGLRHPSPGFVDQPLSDVPIVPRHRWAGLPSGGVPDGRPIGSGPYRLVEHRRGVRYRFAANTGHLSGRPRVDTIEVPFIRGFGRMVAALENRRIDAIPVSLPPDERRDLRRSAFRTRFGTLFAGTTLMFNLRRPPFHDPAARRAVSDALDLQRMSRITIINGIPADRGILHPASGWGTVGAVQRFAPDRARAAFARLDLPTIPVLAPDNDPVRLEAGRQVVLALQRAGARARLVERSARQLADAVGQDGRTPTFTAAIWSTPALASHDPDFLRAVFGSRGAPLNYSGYRSAEFDRLAERVARDTNPDERVADVKSEIDLIARDAPVVALFFQTGAFVTRPAIYDRWSYARGSGILDKRSFVASTPQAAARADGTAARSPGSDRADGGIGAMGYLALGLLLATIAVVLGRGRGRRRRPRRRR